MLTQDLIYITLGVVFVVSGILMLTLLDDTWQMILGGLQVLIGAALVITVLMGWPPVTDDAAAVTHVV